MASKRSHKLEKLAKIYDAEVLPVWSERFGRMLMRDLTIPEGAQVLDVACGTGYPSVEIIRRMGEKSRLIAIDASSAMLDVARQKVEAMGAKGVFFRTESALPKLSFADDVYDIVVCNLGLSDFLEPDKAIADFARVTKPGGQVRCTIPLEGTFQEFFDIYREVLTKHDKHAVIERLGEHIETNYQTPEACDQWLRAAGLGNTEVHIEEFSMLFRSAREFFFAPVIEYGPLAAWKAIAGAGQEMQDVFWYIKEAIDAYFEGRAFEVTVKAGCLVGTATELSDDDVTGRVELIDDKGELLSVAAGTNAGESHDSVDVEFTEPPGAERAGTDRAPGIMAEASGPDVPLDAFSDDAVRPPHLDEDN